MSKDKKVFEFLVDGKTFVSKKMNTQRRGLFFKEVGTSITKIQSDTENIVEHWGDLLLELPDIMWAFVKDEDKQKFSKEQFLDDLDDNIDTEFLMWGIERSFKTLEAIQDLGKTMERSSEKK